MDVIFSIVIVILIFSFLILIHELGHFLAAKASGVMVDEFAIGFGPKIFSKKFGETTYRVNIIFFGGYVKMLGDEDPSSFTQNEKYKDNPRSFQSKSFIQKFIILIAGVTFNAVTAVLIFYVYLAIMNFQPDPIGKLVDYNFFGAQQEELLYYVGLLEDGAAHKAELPSAGFIYRIDDQKVNSRDALTLVLNQNENETIEIDIMDIDRNIATYNVDLAEKNDDGNVKIGTYFTDPAQFPNTYFLIDYGDSKIISGIVHTYHVTLYQVEGLAKLVSNAFQGQGEQLVNSVGTPIKIGEIVYYQVSAKDFKNILNLTGLLSATLAFMNMLPIPIIDGGQIYILIFEKLRGKPLSKRKQEMLGKIGFTIIILMSVVFLLKDVWQVLLSKIFG